MSAEFIATAALRASFLLALGLAALRWLPVERPQLRRLVALFCLGSSLVLPFLPALSPPSVIPNLTAVVSSSSGFATLAWVFALVWLAGGTFAVVRLIGRSVALHR